MAATIAERVAKGAATLDKTAPGWEHDIDLDKLRMSGAFDCVLGQLGTARDMAWEDLVPCAVRQPHTDICRELGFLASNSKAEFPQAYREEYDALQDAWETLISNRLDSGL